MEIQTRREFLADTGKATMLGLGAFSASSWEKNIQNMFIHHVYFWLKEPENEISKRKLIEGLRNLSYVPTIRMFHIGEPANTNRSVIEKGYSVSWLIMFDTAADQDSYQLDPIHLKFVEDCKELWEKVVVYDSIQAQ